MQKQANKFFNNVQINNLKHQPIVFADNLSTPENIGSILRLADNIGVKKVYFINEDFSFRESKIRSVAKTAFKNIDWEIIKSEQVLQVLPNDYNLIAIETCENAHNIYKSKLDIKSAFVVGSESFGISDKLLNLCNKSIYIPMHGQTKSMNVTQSLGVVLFEWLRQNYY